MLLGNLDTANATEASEVCKVLDCDAVPISTCEKLILLPVSSYTNKPGIVKKLVAFGRYIRIDLTFAIYLIVVGT